MIDFKKIQPNKLGHIDPVTGRFIAGTKRVEPKTTPTQITIPRGATLGRLAQQYRTTVDELMRINPQIRDRDEIIAGARLKLPGPVITREPERKRVLFPTEELVEKGADIGIKDVIAEVPEAARKVFTSIGRFAKTIQEEIARSGASVGLTLTGALTGVRKLDISGPELENRIARVIFGDRPLKSIETRIAEAELGVKDFARKLRMEEVDLPLASRELEKSIGKFSEENALALSILGVGAIVGLDFTGMGGKKRLIKDLVKSKSPEAIAGMLKQINVADDLIPATSRKLAGMTDEKAIARAIDKIDEVQRTTRVMKEGKVEMAELEVLPKKRVMPVEKVPEVKPEVKPILKELEPLKTWLQKEIREGRIKSAEEFVEKELPKRFGLSVEESARLRGAHGQLQADNRIIVPKYLPKNFNRTEIITHEIGHSIHRKLSQTDIDVFNSLVRSFKQEIDKALPRIRVFEEKDGKQGYFETFADLYGKYVRGEKLPAGNQFKFYFDEVAPLKTSVPQLTDFYHQAVREVKPEIPIKKPPIKIPTPKVISPTLRTPKGLEITPKRAREIDKMGISPEEFVLALEAQKRGTIPFKEMTARAIKLNSDLDDLLKIKPGTVKEPVQVERFRLIRNRLKTDVDKLKQNYIANPIPENKRLFDEAQQRLNQAYLKIEAIRSEYGRGLSAARIDDELSVAATNLNKVRAKLEPERQIIFDKAVENIDLVNRVEVARLVYKFQDASFIEKVVEYFKNSLLSAPITHIRNITGNTLFNLFDIPVRAFAGGIDAVASRAIPNRVRTVYAGEALKMVYGGVKAIPDATIEAMKALRDEFYIFGTRGQVGRQVVESGRMVPAIKGRVGEVIRVPFRFLGAMDLFSRKIKMTMETDALAYRMAKQKGFKGARLVEEIENIKRNPPSELIDLATKKAERALFLEEFGGIVKKIEDVRGQYPATQFIAVFYRTPLNLVREAYRLTPLRIATAKKDPWLINPSTRMEEISRMTLGSLIGGIIVWKMIDGSIDITGAAPRDSRERDLFYRLGKQPYSVRIGDKWYSYREIHPFSTIVFGAAQIGELFNLYQERGELRVEDIEDRANRLITDTATYIQDLTFFQGVANFVEAISGGAFQQGITQTVPNYLGQLMGGFIPNILSSFQRAADPTIYSTRDFAGQIKRRIPGLAESLIPRRDIYGEPLERPGTFWQRFLSPVQVSKERRDLVDVEMEKLEIAVGFPTRTAFDEPLTDFEYDAYLQDSGARIYEGLYNFMTSEDYEVMTDYEKQEEIEYIVRMARADSRYSLFDNKKEIADYKKDLIEKGKTEAEAEEMAEKRFRIEITTRKIYEPTVRPGEIPIEEPPIEGRRKRILFPGE